MKKLLSALLVLVLLVSGLLSLAGCDDKPESTADVTDTATTLGDTTTAAETEPPETGVTYTAYHKAPLVSGELFNESRYTIILNGDVAEVYNDFFEAGHTDGKEYYEKQSVRYACSVVEKGEYYVLRVTAAYQSNRMVGEGAEEALRKALAIVEEELADPDLSENRRAFYEQRKELLNGKELDRSEELAEIEAVLKLKIDDDGNLLEVLAYTNGNLGEGMYFTYDEEGNLLSSTDGVANQSSERKETTYYANGTPKSHIKYERHGYEGGEGDDVVVYEERVKRAYYFDESGNLIDEK